MLRIESAALSILWGHKDGTIRPYYGNRRPTPPLTSKIDGINAEVDAARPGRACRGMAIGRIESTLTIYRPGGRNARIYFPCFAR